MGLKGNVTMTKSINAKLLATSGLLAISVMAFTADEAHAYDIDCKVILCIAGGFPAECGDAYAYMIKRITRFPDPLSPFGFCPMSDGSEYEAHNVSYRYLRNGSEAYDCPEGKLLYYSPNEEGASLAERETAFCYTHTSRRWTWGEAGPGWETIYHNRSPATPVNFELRITIEPGTQHEFRSKLFRINYSTGYLSQRDP